MSDHLLQNKEIIRTEDVTQVLKDNSFELVGRPYYIHDKGNWFGWDKYHNVWCQFWRKADGVFSFNGAIENDVIDRHLKYGPWRFESIKSQSDLLPIIEN